MQNQRTEGVDVRVVEASEYGGPEVLRVVERPVPVAGPGEVLIRVFAAGTNPVDAECRRGRAAGWFDDGPWVWGWDVCGVVVGCGPGVTRWAEGDEVFGMPLFPRQARAYAEYLVCPEEDVAARPATITGPAASSLPLCGLTAQQILDRCDVRPGQHVLVHGAAGGVGRLAVQLAAERGAHVTGVARAANEALVRDLGASDVLDHTAVTVSAEVRGMDVVVDGVGDDGLLACVRPGGVLAPVPGAAAGPGVLEERAAGTARIVRHVVAPDGPGLGRLAVLVDTGRLRVGQPDIRSLDDVRAVHAELDVGRGRDTVVLVP